MAEEITPTGSQPNTDPGTQPDGGQPNTPPNADPNAGNPDSKGDQGGKPATDDGGKDGNGGEGDKGKVAEGAPEAYDAFTVPEGVNLDAQVNTDLQALAKELNLSQKDAQRIADLGVKQAQRFADVQAQQLEALGEEWGTQAKADKEIGGEKFEENMGVAKKALETFGTPALRDMLDASKLGQHPEVIRFFLKVGQRISEDKTINGNRVPTDADKPLEERAASKLYGNTQKA